jgi:hypothetical protein
MGRAKGRHHNEEVRLREVVSELLIGSGLRRPTTGRHHRRFVLYSIARDIWKVAMASSWAVTYTVVKFG